MTAAYMQILIHAVNNSLVPNVDPSSVAWTGPPPEIVTVQSLLYASLATSLLAAFLAILGKQWVNRYLRDCAGPIANKNRDRQRKLDGLEEWRFNFVIDSIATMLQLALLLFGGTLSLYLWTINRTVAWVILSFTLFGVTSYAFLTLAAVPYYCPYQTPPSILIRTLSRHLTHNNTTFARSVRHRTASLAGFYSRFMKKSRQMLGRLRSALQNPGRVQHTPVDIEYARPAVAKPLTWNFGEICIDWEGYKADIRCISWMLDYTTDSDVIFCAAQFATNTILYPEIANILSPRVLASHFLGCLSHGEVFPGKLEHANVIGMALASVLSVQLCLEPERGDLQRLSHSIHHYTNSVSESVPTFSPGVGILNIVLQTPVQGGSFQKWEVFSNIPHGLPMTDKLCLSSVVLQTIWRWRRIQVPNTVLVLEEIGPFCKGLVANGDHISSTLKKTVSSSWPSPSDTQQMIFTFCSPPTLSV